MWTVQVEAHDRHLKASIFKSEPEHKLRPAVAQSNLKTITDQPTSTETLNTNIALPVV
ncbi:hypothetical protein GJ744_001791 [Endocarpon pusillum]|uniref:Uncharacterized protein n=1 Tax=Endocarpon pusillum TaxID=364733 RepID=A0A8H7ABK4_9EURO|nr:hypothetical protein GJ744_001791 [Endocarpon pusillum]